VQAASQNSINQGLQERQAQWATQDRANEMVYRASLQKEAGDRIQALHSEWDSAALDDDGKPKAQGAMPAPTGAASASSANASTAGAVPAPANGVPAPPAQGVTPTAQGVAPSPSGAIPAPAAAASAPVATAAAQATQAAGGQPEHTPDDSGKKAHSIPAEQWSKWDEDIVKASSAAAAAGHDPTQVAQALTASRNAFVQGHMLRNLQAANVAVLNGDSKGVETALRNAYYYVPDGKDLTIQHGADGQIQYQDPIHPYLDAQGNPTIQQTGTKNMVPVDAAHIKLLGTALLDPMNVGTVIAQTRAASAAQRLEQQKGDAETLQAVARNKIGDARLGEVSSVNLRNMGAYYRDKAYAGYLANKLVKGAAVNGKIDQGLIRVGQDASAAFDEAALGRKTVAPDMIQQGVDKKGQPIMQPNQNAGKITYDTKAVPAWIKNASPEAIAEGRAMAADIAQANARDGMSAERAAQISMQFHDGKSKTHNEGGKVVPNTFVDKSRGLGHVWNGTHWVDFKLPGTSAQALQSGTYAPEADEEEQSIAASGASPSPAGDEAPGESNSDQN
jgi:hypothetical protein